VPVAIVAGRRARILEHSCAENDVNDQNVRSADAHIHQAGPAITVIKTSQLARPHDHGGFYAAQHPESSALLVGWLRGPDVVCWPARRPGR